MKSGAWIAVLLVLGALGHAQAATYRFVGGSSDWFDPSNWRNARGRSGKLPGYADDVVILRGTTARLARNTVVRDITLQPGSRLLARNTTLGYRHFDAREDAVVRLSGSLMLPRREPQQGYTVYNGWGCRTCGYKNPSAVVAVDLWFGGGTMNFGLGGTTAAGPAGAGPGHYATFRGDTLAINGAAVSHSLHYGFVPVEGDEFQIVTIEKSLIGEFANAGEGEVVARLRDVDLRISYRGGDGNDIILRAVAKEETHGGTTAVFARCVIPGYTTDRIEKIGSHVAALDVGGPGNPGLLSGTSCPEASASLYRQGFVLDGVAKAVCNETGADVLLMNYMDRGAGSTTGELRGAEQEDGPPAVILTRCVVPGDDSRAGDALGSYISAVDIGGTRRAGALVGMSCSEASASLSDDGFVLEHTAVASCGDPGSHVQYNLYRDREGYGTRRF